MYGIIYNQESARIDH